MILLLQRETINDMNSTQHVCSSAFRGYCQASAFLMASSSAELEGTYHSVHMNGTLPSSSSPQPLSPVSSEPHTIYNLMFETSLLKFGNFIFSLPAFIFALLILYTIPPEVRQDKRIF